MPKAFFVFGCKTEDCGMIIEETVEVTSPNYMAERASDGESFDEHDVFCPRCGRQYQVQTFNSFSGIAALLEPRGEQIDVGLDLSEDVCGFEGFEPAKDPSAEYRQAVYGLQSLVLRSEENADGILNRMIFAQYIATMEAYLTDKLLLLCAMYPEIEQRVVQKAPMFQKATISLAEAVVDPDAAKRRFRASLQAFLYHDIEKMERLYEIALAGRVFPDAGVRDILMEAVSRRHDCVHRNGFNKDGTLNRFDVRTIRETASAIEALVQQVELSATRTIQKIEDARPF